MAVILLVFSISSVSGVMPSEMVLPSPSSQVNCKNRIYFQCDQCVSNREYCTAVFENHRKVFFDIASEVRVLHFEF